MTQIGHHGAFSQFWHGCGQNHADYTDRFLPILYFFAFVGILNMNDKTIAKPHYHILRLSPPVVFPILATMSVPFVPIRNYIRTIGDPIQGASTGYKPTLTGSWLRNFPCDAMWPWAIHASYQRQLPRTILAYFVRCCLDPGRVVFYRQSDIIEIPEPNLGTQL